MNEDMHLGLHEELLLLALRDKKGTVLSGTSYSMGLGGAILAELLLAGKLEVEATKKKLVEAVGKGRVGDPILDEALQKVRAAKRRASAQSWVTRFAGMKQLRHRVAAGLCRKRVLREDEDKVLLFFRRKLYPEANPRPERRIRQRLRRAVFGDAAALEARTVILVGLAHHTGLLKRTFDRSELRGRKKRIEKIAKGEMSVKATAEAIQAVQAAVMVAAMVPIMAAATTGGH